MTNGLSYMRHLAQKRRVKSAKWPLGFKCAFVIITFKYRLSTAERRKIRSGAQNTLRKDLDNFFCVCWCSFYLFCFKKSIIIHVPIQESFHCSYEICLLWIIRAIVVCCFDLKINQPSWTQKMLKISNIKNVIFYAFFQRIARGSELLENI